MKRLQNKICITLIFWKSSILRNFSTFNLSSNSTLNGITLDKHLAVESSSLCLVFYWNRSFLTNIMTTKEVKQCLITANPHRFNIGFTPGIHIKWSNKTKVNLIRNVNKDTNSQTSVKTAAFQTYNWSIGNRRPFRIITTTIGTFLSLEHIKNTYLISRNWLDFLQDFFCHIIRTVRHCSILWKMDSFGFSIPDYPITSHQIHFLYSSCSFSSLLYCS